MVHTISYFKTALWWESDDKTSNEMMFYYNFQHFFSQTLRPQSVYPHWALAKTPEWHSLTASHHSSRQPILGARKQEGRKNKQTTINKNLAKTQWSQDDAPGIPGIYDWNSLCEWFGLNVQNTHLLRAPWAKHCWPSIGSWPPPISGWENR